MENASKALIIAGAILLSILLISLGIMVYNNAKSTVGQANLSEHEIQTFNGKYTSYVGPNKTAAEVESLIQTAIASNASETQKATGRTVTINGADPSTLTNTVIARTKTYTITATYDPTSGLITNIAYN